MADLATELANLNAKATELLAKYNGAFEKLDEETQNKIIELQDKAAELQTQIESLGFKFDENGILIKEDGSEISVGNALKLGGEDITSFLTRKPDFDSGWISADVSELTTTTITHNLGTTNIVVKALVKVSTSAGSFYSEYNDGDVLCVPVNDAHAGLSHTGLFCINRENEIVVLHSDYVGAADDDGDTAEGFIKKTDFRFLIWKVEV